MIIGYLICLEDTLYDRNIVGTVNYNPENDCINLHRRKCYVAVEDYDPTLPVYDVSNMVCVSNQKYVLVEESVFTNKVVDVYQNVYELDAFELDMLINEGLVAGRVREFSQAEKDNITSIIDRSIAGIDFTSMSGIMVTDNLNRDAISEYSKALKTIFLSTEKRLIEEHNFTYAQLYDFYRKFYDSIAASNPNVKVYEVKDSDNNDYGLMCILGVQKWAFLLFKVIADGVTHTEEGYFKKPEEYTYIARDFDTIVRMPDTVVVIGSKTFNGATITDIRWSKNLDTIEAYAFMEANIDIDMERLELPKSVINIGEAAFCGSDLERITIHDGVKVLPKKLFYECKELIEFDYRGDISSLKCGKDAFVGTQTTMRCRKPFDGTEFSEYRIPLNTGFD